jgi:hypothetical protein
VSTAARTTFEAMISTTVAIAAAAAGFASRASQPS